MQDRLGTVSALRKASCQEEQAMADLVMMAVDGDHRGP